MKTIIIITMTRPKHHHAQLVNKLSSQPIYIAASSGLLMSQVVETHYTT